MNQHLRQVHGKGKLNNDDDKSGLKTEKVSESEKSTDTSANSEKFLYSCKDCGRKFRLKCTLREHSSIHSNERPFECWICHRS